MKWPLRPSRALEHETDRLVTNTTPTCFGRTLLWWPELVATLISICFMIATSVFLYKIDGTRSDEWRMPWHIKPNTVVSLFAAGSRIAMLMVIAECISQLKWVYFEQRPHRLRDFEIFDEASRGPWGSARLVWTMKANAPVAPAGALTAVLALAIEPFAQQVLSFDTRSIDVLTATLPTATIFDSGIGLAYVKGSSSRGTFIETKVKNSDVIVASVRGIGSGAFDSNVRFTCTTSHCAWSTFSSLGMCSFCRDTTPELEISCVNDSDSDGTCKCNITTPQQRSMRAELTLDSSYDYFENSYDTYGWYAVFNSKGGGRTTGPANYSLEYFKSGVSAISVPADKWNETSPQDSDPDCKRHPDLTGVDCELEWCVKKYATSHVIDGVLHDEFTESFRLEALAYYSNGTSCLTHEETLQHKHSRTMVPLQVSHRKSAAQPRQCSPSTSLDDEPDVFWVEIWDVQNIPFVIINMTSGFLEADGWLDNQLAPQIFGANDGNFSKTMENVATSITNFIREGPNSTTKVGTAKTDTIFIRVNWLWLIYPLCLVAFSILFLIAAMLFSAEKSQVVWKSSSIAVLSHGLRTWNTNDMHQDAVKDMQKTSKDVWAQLCRDEDGNLTLVKDGD